MDQLGNSQTATGKQIEVAMIVHLLKMRNGYSSAVVRIHSQNLLSWNAADRARQGRKQDQH
jgi:hypothetical protein